MKTQHTVVIGAGVGGLPHVGAGLCAGPTACGRAGTEPGPHV